MIPETSQRSRPGLRLILWPVLLIGLAAGVAWLAQPGDPSPQLPVCTTNADAASVRGLTLELVARLHNARGLTNPEICAMPDDKLDRAIVKAGNPKPDNPGEAVSFRLLSLRDEFGNIPDDAYSRASDHIKRMEAYAAIRVSPINPTSWTWLGPGNIGGRIRSIVIHPNNPSTMWVGAVSGGIWRSSDAGATWHPENDFMANLAVSTMVMDPDDPDTIYAGTGEGFYNSDAIRGAGVFKTVDGGANWNQLASTANADWYYVNRLDISPDGSTILAATRSGIYRSTDGGSSWTRTLFANVADLDFDPSDGSKAIAGSRIFGGLWYSTDGGASWSDAALLPPPQDAGRVEVAYAPTDPSIVYASIDRNYGELWKSTDGGQNYSMVNSGNSFLGTQGWYDNVVWVDPTDASTMIVGGIDLWRSTDGGSSLTKISQWWSAPSSAHADHHAILEHPDFDGTTNTTVYFGNDGGIYRADDVYTVVGTTGWQELNNNLGITQFYGAAGSTTSGLIIGGTQDNGTLLYTGGTETWTTVFGGDGGWSAADPTDPNYLYGEYIRLRLHRSTNAGLSASYIDAGLGDAGNCANFIAPFILDPNDENRILAGGCSLWRSNNVKAATPTWASIKPATGSKISAVAAADGNPDAIWVGHNNGDIYRTTNGTDLSPTWIRMDANQPDLPDRQVLRIAIDPSDHNIVYASFGGFSPDNIWRTDDGGSTWLDATGSGATGLPDAPVRSLVVNPLSPTQIFAGTEVGVFASEDRGATWWLPHDGPANVSVDELFWMGQTLVAATHGRGLFEVDVPLGPGDPPGAFDKVSPLDGAIELSTFPTLQWEVSLTASSYEYCLDTTNDDTCTNWISSGTNTSITLKGLDPLTTYYWQVRANNIHGTTYAGGSSAAFWSFTTGERAPLLLVDDDDDNPDVRSYYTNALDALGVRYDIWSTSGSDDEPDTALLNNYDTLVWFTGDLRGGAAGPSTASETELANWLGGGGCLFLSSQEYLFDRGLTAFAADYLGLAGYQNDDAGYVSVEGQGAAFGALGPYPLAFPMTNRSDVITPTVNAEVAFIGDNGRPVAINKQGNTYRTTFWGFPFEALSGSPAQNEAMAALLGWCDLSALHASHNIPLDSGWNMISSYVEPADPTLESLMADISDELLLMKNGNGDVYWPALEIDDIGSWNVRDGYQIYMTNPLTLTLSGFKVDPIQTTIPLGSGWNLVAYLLDTAKPADQVLDSISAELQLAKNGLGQVYWPAYSLNQIDSMQPGEGYQINVSTPATLQYASAPAATYVVTTSQDDPLCDTGFDGYIDLAAFEILPKSYIYGDTLLFSFFGTGDPITFYDQQYSEMTLSDDGFVIFDVNNQYGGEPWAPQLVPDPVLPNNLAAPLWQDMEIVYDAATNKGVSAATAGPNVMIVEFDDIQTFGDPQNTYDFEIVMTRTVDDTPGAYEIVFAYDNLNGTLAGPLTIGTENAAGSEATALVNQASAAGAISDGLMVCFDAGPQEGSASAPRETPPAAPDDLTSLLREEPVVLLGYVNRDQLGIQN